MRSISSWPGPDGPGREPSAWPPGAAGRGAAGSSVTTISEGWWPAPGPTEDEAMGAREPFGLGCDLDDVGVLGDGPERLHTPRARGRPPGPRPAAWPTTACGYPCWANRLGSTRSSGSIEPGTATGTGHRLPVLCRRPGPRSRARPPAGCAHPTGVNSRWSSSSPRSIQVGVYSQWRSPGGPWWASEILMSSVRSKSRWRETTASARASGAPAQVWMPWPKAMCWRPLGRSRRSSSG